MGSKLVSSAFTFVAAFNERAREEGQRELEITEVALLTLMAHTCLDDDPSPTFWTKRADICTQLGIRDTEAGRKRVQRALGALAAAKAIALPEKYQRGHTPRYSLIYQGGCLASTPEPEVWTPSIPLTEPKGDALRPKYGRSASRGMDAEHPLEEGRGTKEEGRARETVDDVDELMAPTPTPEPSSIIAPPTLERSPRPYPAQCDAHQLGPNGAPCFACGEARKEHQKSERAAQRRSRPPALRHRVIGGRRVCENRPHEALPNGTCRHCEIRAEDLARELEGVPAA